MFFTSGTTSKPKPVALTYASLHAQSRAKIDLLSLSEHSVYLHLAPLFHLGGFSSALAITLAHGTHIFPPPLHPSNPAHARTLLRCIQTFNVSFLVVVPAILTLLIDVAIRDKVVLPYVRTVLYGGARPAPAVLKDTALVCPNAEIVGAYGMTETASGMTFLRHSDAGETANTCAGSPLPHVEIRVRRRGDDGELGDEVGDGCRGEIVTRGVHVMEGYYAQREETHAAFMDGWMRTGDIGFFKGGLLHVLGRGGDVIRSGGESVFAGEVEDAILCHPHVREAAVVGLPHRILGEAVAAAVVLGSVGDVDSVLNDVKRQCRDVLAGYKCPRWIVQEERLPRTGTGKVMKNSLRQIMSARLKKRLAKL